MHTKNCPFSPTHAPQAVFQKDSSAIPKWLNHQLLHLACVLNLQNFTQGCMSLKWPVAACNINDSFPWQFSLSVPCWVRFACMATCSRPTWFLGNLIHSSLEVSPWLSYKLNMCAHNFIISRWTQRSKIILYTRTLRWKKKSMVSYPTPFILETIMVDE